MQSSWTLPVHLAGHDELAERRRQWMAMPSAARDEAVRQWVSEGEAEWVSGIGPGGRRAWQRAHRALGVEGARALAQDPAFTMPDYPVASPELRQRWHRVCERWGFVRVEADQDAGVAWLSRLPDMEAGWRAFTQAMGLAEHELGAGRLSLMLHRNQQYSAYDRYTRSIHLGNPDDAHSGFTHEWAHALDAHLGQGRDSFFQNWAGAPGLSEQAPLEAFPAPLALPQWERYQGVWSAWGQAWRGWCLDLAPEQAKAGRAQWQQAERMHRRGVLTSQALRPLHLFLDTQPASPQVTLFRRWLVVPDIVPENPWLWSAQQLDQAEGQAYLSTPVECWARAIESVIARRVGPAWNHDRVDQPALFPTQRLARHWDSHWTLRWPTWRSQWQIHSTQPIPSRGGP